MADLLPQTQACQATTVTIRETAAALVIDQRSRGYVCDREAVIYLPRTLSRMSPSPECSEYCGRCRSLSSLHFAGRHCSAVRPCAAKRSSESLEINQKLTTAGCAPSKHRRRRPQTSSSICSSHANRTTQYITLSIVRESCSCLVDKCDSVFVLCDGSSSKSCGKEALLSQEQVEERFSKRF